MQWHVLTDGEHYWGQHWELFNNSPRRPRSLLGPLAEAVLCRGQGAIELETRRAWDTLRVRVHPVPVRFVEREQGKDARIELETERGEERDDERRDDGNPGGGTRGARGQAADGPHGRRGQGRDPAGRDAPAGDAGRGWFG